MGNSIRQLTPADLPALTALSTAAGWNQTAADWMLLLRLNPQGCVGIECEGRVVATTTLICYENELAWLGMVLTQPEYRKRGFARRLVEFALEIASSVQHVRTVKLDATEQGCPLYQSVGFRFEQTIERWSGSPIPVPSAPVGTPDFELDHQAFGANRAQLLKLLAADTAPFVNENGFAMWRPGARKSYLGPAIARSPESAKALIEIALHACAGPSYWDLFPANQHAVTIAAELNFKPERKLARMVKGPDLRGNESMIYAGGGFELG